MTETTEQQKGLNMEVRRGDVYFVEKIDIRRKGSEYTGGRPGIIVSNDIGNAHSGCVEIVYLTTKNKKPLPTHCAVNVPIPCTALCESVVTVSKERLQRYMTHCTDEEMERIDKALSISLELAWQQDKIRGRCTE